MSTEIFIPKDIKPGTGQLNLTISVPDSNFGPTDRTYALYLPTQVYEKPLGLLLYSDI